MASKDKPPKGYRIVKRGRVHNGDRVKPMSDYAWSNPIAWANECNPVYVDEYYAVARRVGK